MSEIAPNWKRSYGCPLHGPDLPMKGKTLECFDHKQINWRGWWVVWWKRACATLFFNILEGKRVVGWPRNIPWNWATCFSSAFSPFSREMVSFCFDRRLIKWLHSCKTKFDNAFSSDFSKISAPQQNQFWYHEQLFRPLRVYQQGIDNLIRASVLTPS